MVTTIFRVTIVSNFLKHQQLDHQLASLKLLDAICFEHSSSRVKICRCSFLAISFSIWLRINGPSIFNKRKHPCLQSSMSSFLCSLHQATASSNWRNLWLIFFTWTIASAFQLGFPNILSGLFTLSWSFRFTIFHVYL